MNRRLVIISVVAIACSRASGQMPGTVAVANDPMLQHHEIRIDQLPKPFATPSSGNPPSVGAPPANATLHAPPGFHVSLFADKLGDPRAMLLAPNGDVILSEPGEGKITILRDANHDGVAEQRFTFASGLDNPYGLAFHGKWLYVGNEGAVVRLPYAPGQTAANGKAEQIAALPSGGHSTRGVLFNKAGTKMYVSIGSRSNVSSGEPPERAAIVEFNPDGSGKRIFAGGLRNPVGMAWEPATKQLWTVVNERDEMGGDLVPDYLTAVQFGGFYGWPYYYWGGYTDHRAPEPERDLRQYTARPDYALGAHVSALGLSFAQGEKLGPQYADGAFVGLHGSWNRRPLSGYKVIFVPFEKGQPIGMPKDVLTGFLNKDEQAQGRPVGVAIDRQGALLVADDVGNRIWRVTAQR